MARRVYRFKTRPWAHQLEAIKRALREDIGYALFMEQRTGKSKAAIDWAGALHIREAIDRVLILCPYGVVGRWHLELNQHMPDEIAENLDIRVVHYKLVFAREFGIDPSNRRSWEVADNVELMKWALKNPERLALIIDESTEVSNPGSAIHRKTYKIARHVPRTLVLTGTPLDKKPIGIFGQFKMIDESVFGTNYTAFKRVYAVYGGYGGIKLTGYKNQARMAKLISTRSFRVEERDCWDIPEERDVVVPVELEESAEIYNRMATDAIVQIQGQEIEAPLAITLALRLQQITGGHLRNSAGRTISVGKEKQRAYSDLLVQLLEANKNKLVTFARFRPELAACARVARSLGFQPILLHGSVKGKDRDRRIAKFQETNKPSIFISQIATGSMGIELSSAADEIFYSLTNSLVNYNQARSRIRGHKQKKKMTYWHLLVDNSIDPLMHEALKAGKSVAKLILEHPEMLRSSFAKR